MTNAVRSNSTGRLLAAISTLLILSLITQAQRRSQPGFTTESSDVVFAIAFSPDAKTLAIARGAREPAQRFGRIELWDTQNGTLRHIIKGFDGPVRSISFSPDGSTLVSASLEYHAAKLQQKALSRNGEVIGELKWWDPQTGNLKNKILLPGEGGIAVSVSYSPDGKQLALVQSFMQFSALGGSIFDPSISGMPRSQFPSRPFTSSMVFTSDLKFLDASTGTQRIKVSVKRPTDVLFSPDGKLVAIIGSNEIKLYDAETGKERQKIKDLKGRATAASFSPDGQNIAVVSTNFERQDDGRFIRVIAHSDVRIIGIHDLKVKAKLEDLGAVNSVAFEPGGRYLVMGGMLNGKEQDHAVPAVQLWDLQSRKVAHFPTGSEEYTQAVRSLSVSRNGAFLAFTTGPDAVELLETDSWKIRQTMDSASAGDAVQRPVGRFLLSVKTIIAVAFSHEGNSLIAETDQGEIKQWDSRTGELKDQLKGEDDPTFVAASTNGQMFAELLDGEITLVNATTCMRTKVTLPTEGSASAVAVSNEGDLMAIGSAGEIFLIDATTGATLKTLPSGGAIDCLAFSNDRRTLVAANESGQLQLWDIGSSRVVKTIAAGVRSQALRLSPNGAILASAEGQRVSLYDVRTGTLQHKLEKHDGPVNALAFSADGQLLATGSDDRTAIVWEVGSGKSKHTLKGHDQTVRTVAFSPDGRLLASGSGNAEVVLWEVESGKLNRVLK